MNNKCGYAIAILVGAVILVSAACYNGFPIVYSDPSTYLASGFELETPFDRPITYGLFLRLASLDGFSMWSIVLLQGLIVSYLIWLTCALLLKSASAELHLLVVVILTICSSLSWVVSQIMPDIFTPIMVLAFILLTSGSLQRDNKTLVFVIYTVSCCMHLSHPLYGFGLIVATHKGASRGINATSDRSEIDGHSSCANGREHSLNGCVNVQIQAYILHGRDGRTWHPENVP